MLCIAYPCSRGITFIGVERKKVERDTRSVPLGQCTDLAYGKTSPTINREASGLFASLLSARGNYL